VLNLRGWLGGLGGAAAVTIGVVIAALIAAGLTATHSGDGHVRMPAKPRQVALAPQSGVGTAVAATSRPAAFHTDFGRIARQAAHPGGPQRPDERPALRDSHAEATSSGQWLP